MSLFLIRNFADLIFVVNPDLREHLLSQGCRPEKIHLSTNGVDLAWLSQLPARVDRRYAGVFLGRLHQSKGIFDLVDIWSTVRNHLPEARLAVIGGGPASLRDELARAVADAGLQSSIDILGYLDATEAFGIVKAADLFVFPSHEEGFGIAPLEAMGCGTPVVAYDLPAYRHVFGSTIETVPCFDYGRLGDRCVALLQDGAHRETRVQAGLAFAQDFDWQAIAQKEWDLLNSMERS